MAVKRQSEKFRIWEFERTTGLVKKGQFYKNDIKNRVKKFSSLKQSHEAQMQLIFVIVKRYFGDSWRHLKNELGVR